MLARHGGQVDHAAAPEHLCTPGDGAAVVAVGGTGHRQLADGVAIATDHQLVSAHLGQARSPAHLAREDELHRVGATQRLERFEPEAR